VRRQSDHMNDYRAALERLRAEGLVYRCFKTRAELMDEAARAPHGPLAPYTGSALPAAEEARRVAADKPFAWRLSLSAAKARLGAAFERLEFVEEGAGPNGEHGRLVSAPEAGGDVILARKDLGVAYHLAVVVDDALQGVDLVVRGADLFEAVGVQRLLQTLLDLPAPAYLHHPILLGPDGKRYAKRDRAETLRALRAAGMQPADLRAALGFG
jgi:glutamyl-Q tRNA(Asp) synthetase